MPKKISSFVATENYCKWNRNILKRLSKRVVWHHKTTKLLTPPLPFVTNLVTLSPR